MYLCHPKLISGSLKETQDTSKRFRNKFGMTQKKEVGIVSQTIKASANCHPKLISGSLKKTQGTSKRFRNKFGMTQSTTKRKFGHSKPHLTQKHTTKPPNVFPTKKASRRTNWQLNFFWCPQGDSNSC